MARPPAERWDLLAGATRVFVLDPVDEVSVSHVANLTSISWSSQDPIYGAETVYDVSGGLLTELAADRGFVRAGCAVSDWQDTPWEDPRSDPLPGDGRYYLVRSRRLADASSWGRSATAIDSRVALHVASPCP